jgi:DNA-binding NarL/FixJ family response regulator
MSERPAPRHRQLAFSNKIAKRFHSLTRREEQVLQLVAWGMTHKQISARLGISVKTVEFHKAQAKTALFLRDRADIVRYAVTRGWFRQY